MPNGPMGYAGAFHSLFVVAFLSPNKMASAAASKDDADLYHETGPSVLPYIDVYLLLLFWRR